MLIDETPLTITKADFCAGTLAFFCVIVLIIGICLSLHGGCADQHPVPQPAGLIESD
jgi:hypothetical protein